MSVDIILKDIEWDGVNKIRVPLEGGGTQDFSIGGGSATLTMYQKYNSTQTGTINGSYTTRVYGANLYNLIGG